MRGRRGDGALAVQDLFLGLREAALEHLSCGCVEQLFSRSVGVLLCPRLALGLALARL